MLIRPATPDDIRTMMALERHAATASHWREEDYWIIFTRPVPQRTALALEENGELKAFIVAVSVGSDWEIENIAVAPDARRRGLGTRLLGEFLELARAQGAQQVSLEVRESNLGARRLYQKWAFVETGRRPGYYADPPEDAITYTFCFPEIVEPRRGERR